MEKTKGIIYTILASVSFGLIPIFTMLAYGTGMSVASVLFWPGLIGSVVLFLYIKTKKIPLAITVKQLVLLALLGSTGKFLTTFFLFFAYDNIGVGVSTAIHFTYPAMVTVLALVFLHEKINTKKIISLCLSVGGIYYLTANSQTDINIAGVVYAFLSAATFTFYMLGMASDEFKKLDAEVGILYITIATVILAPIYGVLKHEQFWSINLMGFIYVMVIGVLLTVVAFILLSKGVSALGSITASILCTLEPIVGIGLGILVLHEQMTMSIFIGSAMVIISVLIIAFTQEDQPCVDESMIQATNELL
jgi:drug/metabolite transporter (DMT)-like permease